MRSFCFLLFLFFSVHSALADHNEYDRTIMFAASWFSAKCEGIEKTEQFKQEIRDYSLSEESQKKSRDVPYLKNRFSARWKKLNKGQQEAMCFQILVKFGPNGKVHKGWLTATPELQEKLPIDIKKDLGF